MTPNSKEEFNLSDYLLEAGDILELDEGKFLREDRVKEAVRILKEEIHKRAIQVVTASTEDEIKEAEKEINSLISLISIIDKIFGDKLI